LKQLLFTAMKGLLSQPWMFATLIYINIPFTGGTKRTSLSATLRPVGIFCPPAKIHLKAAGPFCLKALGSLFLDGFALAASLWRMQWLLWQSS
jgi:hypothetical protein